MKESKLKLGFFSINDSALIFTISFGRAKFNEFLSLIEKDSAKSISGISMTNKLIREKRYLNPCIFFCIASPR